ncbi:hypothetical protein AC1031_022146 [Aphanomyces cochlioides]|nr:hypothetical protein AC1031_022146 [Aphanomyces cochlioides]
MALRNTGCILETKQRQHFHPPEIGGIRATSSPLFKALISPSARYSKLTANVMTLTYWAAEGYLVDKTLRNVSVVTFWSSFSVSSICSSRRPISSLAAAK